MAAALPTPIPLTDAEVKLLRDAEDALKRSRELLAQIEILLAFRHARWATQRAEKSLSPLPDPDWNELSREAVIKQP